METIDVAADCISGYFGRFPTIHATIKSWEANCLSPIKKKPLGSGLWKSSTCLAKRMRSKIFFPVDSEHSARVFQCFDLGDFTTNREKNLNPYGIRRTFSAGKIEQFCEISNQKLQALKHPNWENGGQDYHRFQPPLDETKRRMLIWSEMLLGEDLSKSTSSLVHSAII